MSVLWHLYGLSRDAEPQVVLSLRSSGTAPETQAYEEKAELTRL